jgi:hypothetical protein
MDDPANSLAKVAARLMKFQTAMKIHHWQTKSFAHHKASDALLDSLSDLVDRFMESLQGSHGDRLAFGGQEYMFPVCDVSDEYAGQMIARLRAWLLRDLPALVQLDSGLTNIRDEMVSALDTTQYLFTFQ